MLTQIKKIMFVLTVLVSGGFIASAALSGVAMAGETVPDIRHRTIVYFYPDTVDVKEQDLVKQISGFERVSELPRNVEKASVSLQIVTDIQPPDMSFLAYFGRGLSRHQAESIQKSKLALIIDYAYPWKMQFKGLKLADKVSYDIANSYGATLWDAETRELFVPEQWKVKRLQAWEGELPVVEDHIVIHAYKNNDYVRAVTLGMVKFGLPDIVVNDFLWSLNRLISTLINLLSQSLVEGERPLGDGTLKINIDTLADTQFKKTLQSTLIENADPAVNISTGVAMREEGDPDNYLMEILFDNVNGVTLQARQEQLLAQLFGWKDEIFYIKHNKLIEEASARAKAKLPGLRSDFNKGLAPGEFIQVKAPFKTPDNGTEWMWVEVISWKGYVIKGLLKNQPYNIPSLKGGAEVEVNQNDIFDYYRSYPDGRTEGNETSALIMKYQS